MPLFLPVVLFPLLNDLTASLSRLSALHLFLAGHGTDGWSRIWWSGRHSRDGRVQIACYCLGDRIGHRGPESCRGRMVPLFERLKMLVQCKQTLDNAGIETWKWHLDEPRSTKQHIIKSIPSARPSEPVERLSGELLRKARRLASSGRSCRTYDIEDSLGSSAKLDQAMGS